MLGQSFNVEVRPAREQLVIEVCGEVDLATAPQIHEIVANAVGDGWNQLIVDLRAVSFMDSAGVHLLLKLRELRQDGVNCQMIDGRPEIHRVLGLCGLGDVLGRADPANL